jgi:uncharacterized protein (DUF169 family)
VKAPLPASCSYWKLASEGKVFYTTADDRLNCKIGAHTHGVVLSPEEAAELRSTIGQMIGLNYLGPEEVPQIPQRTEAFQVAVYSPFAQSPCEPQIVLIRGNARQFMFVAEAAIGAGIGSNGSRARPTHFCRAPCKPGVLARVLRVSGTVFTRIWTTTNSTALSQV